MYILPVILSVFGLFSIDKKIFKKLKFPKLKQFLEQHLAEADKRALKIIKKIFAGIFICSIPIYIFVPSAQASGQVIVEKYYPPVVVEKYEEFYNSLVSFKDTIVNVGMSSEPQSPDYNKCDIFYIENPDRELAEDDWILINSLFEYNSDKQHIESFVKSNIYSQININSHNNLCSNDFEAAQDQEDAFTEKVMLWDKSNNDSDVPVSSELDSVIDTWQGLINKEQYNYVICQRLSNACQLYASEYNHQTDNGDMILYYYCKSICYDIETLKCTDDEKVYRDTIKRIFYRYNDIKDCEKIDNAYRNYAKPIRDALNNKYHFMKE